MEEKFPEEAAIVRQYQKAALRDAATKEGIFNTKTFLSKVYDLEPEIQKAIFFPDELKQINNVRTYLNSFPKNFNPSGTSGMSAFREFFKSPTGAVVSNARDFGIEAFIKTMGALPETARPNPIDVGSGLAQKFNNLNAAKTIADRQSSRIIDGTKALLTGGGIASATGEAIKHSYDDRTERIKELANNPGALQAHIQNHIDGISKHLPGVSQATANSIVNQVNFLNSKIPKPAVQLPLSPKYVPSNAEKQKFDKFYDTVNDPIGTMKKIKTGQLTNSEMEALKITHPELLNEMQNSIKSQISPDLAKKMPYHTKLAISKFLEMPLDSSNLPTTIQMNQAVFANQPINQRQKNVTSPKSSLGGLKELKVSGRYATEINRDEGEKNRD